MNYRIEFPDYPEADMPAIPPEFSDISWHNDGCPMFHDGERQLTIQTDYLDPALRAGFIENDGEPGSVRFALIREELVSGTDRCFLYEGDSWDELLAAIADHN